MNESLAYKFGLPIVDRSEDNRELIPVPIVTEVRRIEQMLRKNGYAVYIKIKKDGIHIGCMNDSSYATWERFYPEKDKPDCVLAICCPAGQAGIQQLSGDIPVKCITKQLGVLSYTFSIAENGRREIERNASSISPFQ